MRTVSIIILCLLTTGCTEAQMRVMSMRSQAIATVREAKSCVLKADTKPEYAPLWSHVPIPPAAPTLSQLADKGYPSPSEVILIKMRHDELTPCRERIMDRLTEIDSRVAAAFSDHFSDGDRILLDLIERKKTWGQANQASQQLQSVAKKQLLAALHDIDGELRQQNDSELEQRRQAAQRIAEGFAAVVQAGAAVAEAAEAEREARRASLPVVTTCNQILNNTTCVSR